MVRAAFVHVLRADAVDEPLLFIGHAIAVCILVQREKGRMQYPQFSVVVNESARMIHFRKRIYLVCLAIAIGVEATHYTTTVFFFAKATLFVNAHKHLTRRGRCDADRIID